MMTDLDARTFTWAERVGLLDSPDPAKQLERISGELIELTVEVAKFLNGTSNLEKVEEELGDVMTATSVLAAQLGLTGDRARGVAMTKVEGRTGKMVNGTFVKTADLPK